MEETICTFFLKGATNSQCIFSTEIPVVQRTERCCLLFKEEEISQTLKETTRA